MDEKTRQSWCDTARDRALLPFGMSGLAAALMVVGVSCGGGGSSGVDPADTTEQIDVPRTDLPAGVIDLDDDLDAELLTSAMMPVKLAVSPDGRLFYTELDSGQIRIVGADDVEQAAPFATISVLTGGERGLIGLALSPDFATDRFVYVLACVSGPDRMQVIRLQDSSGVGISPTVIIDNLPISAIHNGGDIEFMLDGTLLVSTGDVENAALAQTDNELAGRILRYNADGSIPADNPDPTDPEFCRGFRNPFDLEVHPTSGQVFISENGPATNDELNVLRAGKNYEWPSLPMGVPQSDVGTRLQLYVDVIAPTGMAVHSGSGWPTDYANSLYLASYSETEIRRFPLSGPFSIDLDDEFVFMVFEDTSTANLPLDMAVDVDGDLLISTFSGIWRVFPKPAP